MVKDNRRALIIKRHWLDLILSGRKTWELRGMPCNTRGRVELAVSGAKCVGKKIIGQVLGRCQIVGCKKLKRQQLASTFRKHRVVRPKDVKYKHIYAWVVKNAKRYCKPKQYLKPNGAITWVKLIGKQWQRGKRTVTKLKKAKPRSTPKDLKRYKTITSSKSVKKALGSRSWAKLKSTLKRKYCKKKSSY
eukprot:gnl/MRDRNA2_/MRDRNA2_130397_c0_seq1.p1 gnl/MRDRNA2_/MRDRNA2_130397_c0~~gnl/MRDRNA2_/MRDRNA2_130397_c0_seq1.p1  ORF type:complete len:190 (-),score=35.68 gnl/MRDRNA2_/MRDRNA2_130397_c0_seq1:17-586(-)